MLRNRKVRNTTWFDVFNIIVMLILSWTFLYPFLMVLRNSFITNLEIAQGGLNLIPKTIQTNAYQYLLAENTFFYRAFFVSVCITVGGTLLNILFTSTMAYGLAVKGVPGRTAITMLVFITMLFSGGLIPTYLLMTALRLRNTYLVLVIGGLISPWLMFIMRNFFSQIPASLTESAFMDRATELRIYSSIILPMSLPSLATIGLFYAVGHWNNWFTAAIYLTDIRKWPLQLVLRELIFALELERLSGGGSTIDTGELAETMPKESVKAAAIILSSIPIIMVYPFIQKYFVKGLTVGSIKG